MIEDVEENWREDFVKLRRQIEFAHALLAQLQARRAPAVMPAPTVNHAACDVSARAYDRPFVTYGRSSTVILVYREQSRIRDASVSPYEYNASMRK